MRTSTAIGIAAYVLIVGSTLGGACLAVDAIIGSSPAQSASLGTVKQGPGAPHSGKWTPVEIKREVAQVPPIPAYVTPSSAERARLAAKVAKRNVVLAQRTAPPAEQQLAAYAPVQSAYAPEQTRTFGPFTFKF